MTDRNFQANFSHSHALPRAQHIAHAANLRSDRSLVPSFDLSPLYLLHRSMEQRRRLSAGAPLRGIRSTSFRQALSDLVAGRIVQAAALSLSRYPRQNPLLHIHSVRLLCAVYTPSLLPLPSTLARAEREREALRRFD